MKTLLLSLLLMPALLSGCDSAKNTAQTLPVDATRPPSSGSNQPSSGIVGKYWKLVTLEGQPVKMAPDQEREAYFMLRDSSQVRGFGGCNTLNGSYELQAGNRLRFVNLLTTLKACPDMEGEGGFLEVLNLADNYTLTGDTLRLNVGRRAPLAVFHAVYF